jgi:hypothetical protein
VSEKDKMKIWIYEGYNKNGLFYGKCRVVYYGGSYYEGDLVDNKMQGFGVYFHFSGDKYEGQFANDLKHGKACIISQTEINMRETS